MPPRVCAGGLLGLVIFLTASFTPKTVLAQAVPVRVEKSAAGWRLLVAGQPFFIKGVSTYFPSDALDEGYFRLASELGANTVRFYGVVPRTFLDLAARHGLKVDAGVWFNAIRLGTTESYRDPAHRQALKQQTLAYVNEMKDHPSILFWTLGNEVFSFTADAAERQAFGLFLNDLVQSVHQADPLHPIAYASPATHDFVDLKRYAPDIDIIGLNTFAPPPELSQWFKDNAWEKPVYVSEFGPAGSWTVPKDKNGLPIDPPDDAKAENYRTLWQQITSSEYPFLGGLAFVLGDQRNQDSLTWYNLNYNDMRRAGYWAIYTAYTGLRPANAAPKITSMNVAPDAPVEANGIITVSARASDQEGDPLQYAYFMTTVASDPLLAFTPEVLDAHAAVAAPGTAQLSVPAQVGTYRVYVTVSDNHNNIAIANQSVRVQAAPDQRILTPVFQMKSPAVVSVNDRIAVGLPAGSAPAETFRWNVTLLSRAGGGGAFAGTRAEVLSESVSTSAPALELDRLKLSPGRYRIDVSALNRTQTSGTASLEVSVVAEDLSSILVYPNPWRADKHGGDIVFANLSAGATVRIFTVSGHSVRTLRAAGESVSWDRKNASGDLVGAGMYVYMITDSTQAKARGQLVIIR